MQFGTQKLGPGLGTLVPAYAVLQKAPAPVYDLRAGLDCKRLFGIWDVVFHQSNILWIMILESALHLHPFLTVNHLVVDHAVNLEGVGLGRVSVENYMSAFEKLVSQILPFLLAGCSWSRCALYYDEIGQRNVYVCLVCFPRL